MIAERSVFLRAKVVSVVFAKGTHPCFFIFPHLSAEFRLALRCVESTYVLTTRTFLPCEGCATPLFRDLSAELGTSRCDV
jgi:hypothetical protein